MHKNLMQSLQLVLLKRGNDQRGLFDETYSRRYYGDMGIDVGFAHCLGTLNPNSEIGYKCVDFFTSKAEAAVRCAGCGIDWPLSGGPLLSDKDAIALALVDFDSPFIYGKNS